MRDPVASTFVLTPLQKGFLAESLLASDKGVNIEQIVWELDHVPDADRFRAAWQSALDAFDALRLSFAWPGSGGEPRQSIVPSVRLPFQRVDWPEQLSTQPDHRLASFLAQDRRAGLDLSSAPLMRVSLLVLARCRAVCVWTVHHAIIDANSYAAVLQHVLDHYAPLLGLAQVPGDARPPFTDFLRWLESYDSEPGTRHFADLLRDFGEPTPLPLQEDSGRTAENRSSLTSLSLDLEATAKLRAVAQTTASSPNTLVQLAWAQLLSRYSGADDVLFGATWSGRTRTIEQAARVVGPLINTLPVRVRLSEAGTVRDLLGVLRQQHLALRHFEHAALRDIRAASPLAPFAQLFQTNVVFDNERFYSALPKQDTRWRGHKIWCRSQTSVPLVLAAYFLDGALVMDLEYDVGLYTDQMARRLLADYRRLLTNINLSLDDSPYTVPMLDESRCAQLTVDEFAPRAPASRPVGCRTHIRACFCDPARDGREGAHRTRNQLCRTHRAGAPAIWRAESSRRGAGCGGGRLAPAIHRRNRVVARRARCRRRLRPSRSRRAPATPRVHRAGFGGEGRSCLRRDAWQIGERRGNRHRKSRRHASPGPAGAARLPRSRPVSPM